MMHASRRGGGAVFCWAQACSIRRAAGQLTCWRRTANPVPRMFSTLESVRVTAADEAVTVTIESGGASYSASAECGRAASGRGAAEAERAGTIMGQVLQGMDVGDQNAIDDELVRPQTQTFPAGTHIHGRPYFALVFAIARRKCEARNWRRSMETSALV